MNAAVTLPTDTEFNNYVVPPVPVNVNFTKALAGRALVAGEFTFEMKDENGLLLLLEPMMNMVLLPLINSQK